jgi:YggT family protein
MSVIKLFIELIAQAYQLAIIAAALISWLRIDPNNQLVAFINRITQPVFDRIREYVPPVSGFDWSPVVAFILVAVIKRLLFVIL